jgi:hypothetical protein
VLVRLAALEGGEEGVKKLGDGPQVEDDERQRPRERVQCAREVLVPGRQVLELEAGQLGDEGQFLSSAN